MEQQSRISLLPPLTVNTYQAYQGSVESEFSFQVNIKIEQNRLYFNKTNFTVSVHLGCYELTFLKPKLLKAAPKGFYFDGNVLAVSYPTTSMMAKELDLSAALEFESDQVACGPFKGTSYSDSKMTTATVASDPVGFKSNPTIKNLTAGTFSPILRFPYF